MIWHGRKGKRQTRENQAILKNQELFSSSYNFANFRMETDLFLSSSDTENALVATSGMSVSRPHKSQMSLLTIFATDGGKDSKGLQPLQQLDLK